MTLVQSGLPNLQIQIYRDQNVSGLTKWKEVGKINFKWTIEDYNAHQVFQRSVKYFSFIFHDFEKHLAD